MQNIAELPDVDISLDESTLKITNNKPEKMITANHEHVYLAAFVQDELYNRNGILDELEDSYDAIAEYCATEIEDNDDAVMHVVELFISHIWEGWPSNTALVKTDKTLRKYKHILDEWMKNQKEDYLDTLNACLPEVIAKNHTEQYISDMFRKSGSFDEIMEKITTNGRDGLVLHMNTLETDYWDAVKIVLKEYLQKKGVSTQT